MSHGTAEKEASAAARSSKNEADSRAQRSGVALRTSFGLRLRAKKKPSGCSNRPGDLAHNPDKLLLLLLTYKKEDSE